MFDPIRFGITLSQALNSIKHTPGSFSSLYGIDKDEVSAVIDGISEPSARLISILENHPVIDFTLFSDDLCKFKNTYIPKNLFLQSKKVSNKSKRSFVRGKINYYTYKDLAASFDSPFLPEHITPNLKYNVEDKVELDNCYFNKGHLEHQITLFIGEVNFHWKRGSKKYIKAMNNLDLNYITPYVPHTFTTRKKGSYIVAITYKSIYSYFPSNEYKKYASDSTQVEAIENSNKQGVPAVEFWQGSHFNSPRKLINRVRTPEITLHSTDFRTSSYEGEIHSWLYVIEGNAEINDSNSIYQLLAGDSLLIKASGVIVEFKSPLTRIVEICLSVDKQQYERFVKLETSQLARSHTNAIFERMYNDTQTWF